MKKISREFIELKTGICAEDCIYANQINACVKYLKDNEKTDQEIFNILNLYKDLKDIKSENLPDDLWENSILKKNTFYFHDILRIISNVPSWNPITQEETIESYFLEMKIMFTIDDLLEYYYSSTKIPIELRDKTKDKGAFEYLLKKYKVMKPEPIDFILFLIDESKSNNDEIINVFDLQKYETTIYKMFENIYENKTIKKEIVWREK